MDFVKYFLPALGAMTVAGMSARLAWNRRQARRRMKGSAREIARRRRKQG